MKPKKRVVAIYTAPALIEACKALFTTRYPEIELINIVDDRLIFDINDRGEIDDKLAQRVMSYFAAADNCDADAVLCTCSSIGEVADRASTQISTPVIKIDAAMIDASIENGGRIGVLATLASTLEPTVRFIEKTAAAQGVEVHVVRGLADGAYDAAVSGDVDEHDRRITMAAIDLLKQGVDVFVLAQASMARIQNELSRETGKPVLTSLESGIDALAAELGETRTEIIDLET